MPLFAEGFLRANISYFRLVIAAADFHITWLAFHFHQSFMISQPHLPDFFRSPYGSAAPRRIAQATRSAAASLHVFSSAFHAFH
jgi:hypothetical protein